MSSEQSNIDETGEPILADEAGGKAAKLKDAVTEYAQETDEEESIEQQLSKAQDTIKEYWEQIMRLRAEIDNNRKRAERDVENAHKYALKGFIENLLPVVDSMEMGQVAAGADNATLESIREGSNLTIEIFIQALQKQGLEQLDPIGEKFDPERHQAISMVEVKGSKSNTVIEVMQKGFTLNDRLVRPAMVVVAK
jgi:molecular chaperone GrpE